MHRLFVHALLLLFVIYVALFAYPGTHRKVTKPAKTALNVLRPPHRVPLWIGRAVTLTTCGFVRNSNIYGLGIRIGYYSQFTTGWIQSYLMTRRSSTIRSVNILFILAMLAGLVILSSRDSNSYAVETFLLLQIIPISYFLIPVQTSQS